MRLKSSESPPSRGRPYQIDYQRVPTARNKSAEEFPKGRVWSVAAISDWYEALFILIIVCVVSHSIQ
jgi:hypothetical protein